MKSRIIDLKPLGLKKVFTTPVKLLHVLSYMAEALIALILLTYEKIFLSMIENPNLFQQMQSMICYGAGGVAVGLMTYDIGYLSRNFLKIVMKIRFHGRKDYLFKTPRCTINKMPIEIFQDASLMISLFPDPVDVGFLGFDLEGQVMIMESGCERWEIFKEDILLIKPILREFRVRVFGKHFGFSKGYVAVTIKNNNQEGCTLRAFAPMCGIGLLGNKRRKRLFEAFLRQMDFSEDIGNAACN